MTALEAALQRAIRASSSGRVIAIGREEEAEFVRGPGHLVESLAMSWWEAVGLDAQMVARRLRDSRRMFLGIEAG